MGKYDSKGNLTKTGIAFRETTGPREVLIPDTMGDMINNIQVSISPEFVDTYTYKAFGKPPENIADFARRNGLNGKDIL